MKNKFVIIGIVAIVAMVCLSGCTGTTQDKDNSNTNTNSNPDLQQNETEIRIPISDISTTAKFYSYDSTGVTIRYFAVKDQQGTVHVALDACDVCYEAKKGYKQSGDAMQCLNCGKTFAITSIGKDNKAGGCWPSYLPMTINGDKVIIKKSDLLDRRFMFT